jgi:hypothetical protein
VATAVHSTICAKPLEQAQIHFNVQTSYRPSIQTQQMYSQPCRFASLALKMTYQSYLARKLQAKRQRQETAI